LGQFGRCQPYQCVAQPRLKLGPCVLYYSLQCKSDSIRTGGANTFASTPNRGNPRSLSPKIVFYPNPSCTLRHDLNCVESTWIHELSSSTLNLHIIMCNTWLHGNVCSKIQKYEDVTNRSTVHDMIRSLTNYWGQEALVSLLSLI
jgi:hypothetical protein